MSRRAVPVLVCSLVLALASFAPAQTRLTLGDAIARARARNRDARIAEIAQREAESRVARAQAGFWPRVDFTGGWQRGNQPVFVFSSLLAQRRFTEANFAIPRLNHPDPVNNVRSGLAVEQLLFDGGAVRAGVAGARLGRDVAALERRRTESALAVQATEAYGQVLASQADRDAAANAAQAAEQDLARSRARRDAGLVTEADVLAVEVHLARVRERAVRASGAERVARARLNEVIGAPLDEVFVLDPTALPSQEIRPAADLEREALDARPEVALAAAAEALARTAVTAARAPFLPQVAVQGGWEWNGDALDTQVSSWIVGAQLRLNLFNGLGDRARLAEARHALERHGVERERAETRVRLDVRQALARLEAARAAEAVSRAAVGQARERQRITRDRYEAGLVDVTTLLSAAQGVLDAEAQATAARVDALVHAAALDRALGR